MPQALIGLGNVYVQQRDFEAAIEALEEAIELAPDSPEAYYALGGAYAQSGDTESACETYSRFLELDPPANWKAQAEQTMAALGCQ
jgi:tetratricopeptide (TPR) repeat protein